MSKEYFYITNGKKNIDMFLDPTKIKDYMHVNDYCDAVLAAIENNMWYQDWNVAAETPLMTGEIVDLIKNITSFSINYAFL